MNKKDLKEISSIGTSSIAKLAKSERVTTTVLLKISKALDCSKNDIMEAGEITTPRRRRSVAR
jgi:DNA-binding Xre family transcriptional regulator